jgi:hypothetical protein
MSQSWFELKPILAVLDFIVGDFRARLMHTEIRMMPFNRKSRDGA